MAYTEGPPGLLFGSKKILLDDPCKLTENYFKPNNKKQAFYLSLVLK